MEEKERYSWYNHSTEEIYDNKDDIVFVGAITVLNQQNRRIWELIEENKQLKQSQNQLVISKLREIENWCEKHKDSDEYDYMVTYSPDKEDASGCTDYLEDYIDNQIKELKGEK